jgi:hypothetical protein
LVTPNQFESIAKIELPTIVNEDKIGIKLGDPNYIVARYSLPTGFPLDVIKSCGFAESKSPGKELLGHVKFTSSKGPNPIIEIRVQLNSMELSKECNNAIFEDISDYLRQQKNSYLENANLMLQQNKIHQKSIGSRPKSVKNPESVDLFEYLAQRDHIKFLMEQESKIYAKINSIEQWNVNLLVPIYSVNTPVFPSKKFIMVFGILVGLALGGLVALIKVVWFSNQKAL